MGQLQEQLADEEAFASGLYPLAVHDLLSGRSIGLVFLGSSSDQIDGLVRSAVTQAGGDLSIVVAVREPLDLRGIGGEATGTHYAALASSPALVGRFGELAGKQFVRGGAADRSRAAQPRALQPAERLRRAARPPGRARRDACRPDRHEPRNRAQASAAFETGLLDGVAAVGVPAVGVEVTEHRTLAGAVV